jgi:hypothetical protein
LKVPRQKPAVRLVEFRALITHKMSERGKKRITLVAIRTVEEFSNFQYEIVVKDHISEGRLFLEIHGLRAPSQVIPASGPATFKKEFDDLTSVHEILLSRLDGQENSFQIKITRDDVHIVKSPEKRFVELVAKEEEW